MTATATQAPGSTVPRAAQLIRVPLKGPADPGPVMRWLREEPRPVALAGRWAGGGALLTSHPLAVAAPDEPFAALDEQPDVDPGSEGAVGGGWFGWFGFDLARTVEPTLPAAAHQRQTPASDVAFHDHLVRQDTDGRWWFEALWSEPRAADLDDRLAVWRERLSRPAPPRRDPRAGVLNVVDPGTAGHEAAVAEGLERIAAGEVFQVNLCLRLQAELRGDVLDAWVDALTPSTPAYAAYVGADGRAVASLSPELFLRRRGRRVEAAPIKGTAPASEDPLLLRTSAKDRAENIMIVDLMRNDLGRVCRYGTVSVSALCVVEPAAGVWHLVSTITGELRDDVSDGDLLRATFPPGSVVGAPKVQALRVIDELESSAREAYCGAVGFASPTQGLELNVAIRTFETAEGQLWLGAGGGVVADSTPEGETAEALTKARGTAAAAGLHVRTA